jgi:hypothetical protein
MPTILVGWAVLILVALAMTLYTPLRTARYPIFRGEDRNF